jgi:hypothetical protein
MRKLVLILLAFLAVFTYIRALEGAETEKIPLEIPVEIAR